jgi:hypothetical protein
MFAVITAVKDGPRNPRFATLALRILSMSLLPAFLIAAVTQVMSRSSPFRSKFYFLFFVCNITVGSFVLLSAIYGLLRELGFIAVVQ